MRCHSGGAEREQMELQGHIDQAKQLAVYAKERGLPCAFEVVKLARRTVDGDIYNVQPFGMHAMFKSHKLVHIEPIPQ